MATSTLLDIGAKVLSSANAIHHYYDLAATLGSWVCVLRPGALVFVCSGNLRNPHCRPGDWIIDETVDKVNEIAADVVRREPAFDEHQEMLEDSTRMAAHTKLWEKVFVPVRPLDQYPDAFPCNWTYITCPR